MGRKGTYIFDEQPGSLLLRKILTVLLALALIASIVTAVIILSGRNQVDQVLERFETALADQDYDTALSIYRETQEHALSDSWLDRNQDDFEQALVEMDRLIEDRLNLIESGLSELADLTSDDLAFIEDMAETTAVHLITYLRGLCRGYLQGQQTIEVVTAAFDQVVRLDNVNTVIGSLPDQFDQMTLAQPTVMAAIQAFEQENYWDSWDDYTRLLDDAQYDGFVHDEALALRSALQAAMYQPLMDEASALMDGGRFLSARNALNRMAEVYPEDKAVTSRLETCAQHLPEVFVSYTGPIELISIKPLIVRPDLAFDNDAYAAAADDTMLTTTEFSNLLQELYRNDYILIDSSRVYTENRTLAALELPEGKKPLVLVLEGLNYYATRRLTGNCWDLVLDEGGEVAGIYQTQDSNMTIDRSAEAIGLLDQFVSDHPDFSLDGAKGTISLTGYECVFGKVTDRDQLDDRNQALAQNGFAPIELTSDQIEQNRTDVQQIIDRLSQTGWQFASSTYGYINARSQSLDRLQEDTQKWLDQVGKLTGPVAMINYPNGAFITGSDERAIWLQDQGFILFGGLGTSAYLYIGDNYIYVDKTPINGYTLRNPGTVGLSRLLKAGNVLDR